MIFTAESKSIALPYSKTVVIEQSFFRRQEILNARAMVDSVINYFFSHSALDAESRLYAAFWIARSSRAMTKRMLPYGKNQLTNEGRKLLNKTYRNVRAFSRYDDSSL